MKIAVAGATGRVGRHIVDSLRTHGHGVVEISRSGGVDVLTGEGLLEALTGVECVIDAASGPSPEQAAATAFFTTAARNLHQAGQRAGVQTMITISIIGIDRFTAGYMAAKLAHEKAMRSGPIPVGVVRAAQFHELIGQFVEWGRKGNVSYLQKTRLQPVAARTVAQAIAGLAGDPNAITVARAAGVPILEIAGPRPENLVDVATQFAARQPEPIRIEGGSNPDDPDRGLYEGGALLPGPNAVLAGPSFEEWLSSAIPLRATQGN